MSNSPRLLRLLPVVVVLATMAVLTAVGLSLRHPDGPPMAVDRAGAPPQSPPGKINIVIFLIDALRADRLGIYGYTRRPTSPRIDALADEAVVFENAYAPSPWTLPTVMSLLTSTFACEHNVLDNNYRLGDTLDPLAVRLKPLGYTNIDLYANPFAGPRFGLGRGYDFVAHGETDGRRLAQLLDRYRNTPLFLYIHNVEPHNPFQYTLPGVSGFREIPTAVRSWFAKQNRIYRRLTRVDFNNNQPPGTTDNSAEQQRALAALCAHVDEYNELYDTSVRVADQRVGSVIDTLKSRNLWADTLFIVLSDHGEEIGERGGWLHDQSVYEELMHVPLIVRFPGSQFGGRRVKSVVSLVDVMPTIFGYMQRPDLSYDTRGRNLMPLIRGQEPDEDRELRITGIRINRKKYYRPWKESRGDVNLVIRRGNWKGIWNAEIGTFELYDLSTDPRERNNLQAQQSELASAMLDVARSWQEECGSRAAQAQAADQQMDEETLRRLRILGYVDGGDEEEEQEQRPDKDE